MKFRKTPPYESFLENIQEEGERLSRLVQNLLEVTRLESGTVRIRKELYPLEEVIGSALERVERSMPDRPVTVDFPENLPLVPMDAMLVEQVFANLLENGIRHAPVGSGLEVSASADDKVILVTVSDHGAGLKEDEMERVFDKFYHDKASPGAGLGLAICRAVVNAHGGRIWAANGPDHGAVFQFTLPLPETSHGK